MNFSIEIYENEYISNCIKKNKMWEGINTEIILEIIRENKSIVFIDIGANIGWFSLVCASHGIKSIAFEPIKANTKLFKKSIELNGYGGLITLHEIALGDKDGFVDLNIDIGNMGLCSENPIGHLSYIERCEMRRLDEIITPNPPNPPTLYMIKMDVEEMELKVLRGMSQLLKSGQVRYIILEISLYNEELFEILEKNGFLYCIDLGFDKEDHVFNMQTNYLHTQKYFTSLACIRDNMRVKSTMPIINNLSRQRNILFSSEKFSL